MAFYQSISEYYDHIFPLNNLQTGFVTGSFDAGSELKILDIGCGTGSLSIALASCFKKVIGIDPDTDMLSIAENKADNKLKNLSFEALGMLDIGEHFQKNTFDGILCFGNTLVHLGSEKEMQEFLDQANYVLKPGGKLMIQIINYDRVIDQNIKGLPTIENEFVKFTRKYTYHPEKKLLDFETLLSIKSEKREIGNIIHLYPIRRAKLIQLVRQSGFSDIRVWGNFKREALVPESIPLVIEVIA